MALASTETIIFLMVIGFGTLYLGFKRNAIMWPIIAAVVFGANIMFAATIPFATAADGTVIGTPANVMLSGISMLFAFIAIIKAVHIAFSYFRS